MYHSMTVMPDREIPARWGPILDYFRKNDYEQVLSKLAPAIFMFVPRQPRESWLMVEARFDPAGLSFQIHLVIHGQDENEVQILHDSLDEYLKQ